jgi:hypothetical protein
MLANPVIGVDGVKFALLMIAVLIPSRYRLVTGMLSIVSRMAVLLPLTTLYPGPTWIHPVLAKGVVPS